MSKENKMDKASATIMGALVDNETAKAFTKKCLPHSTADIISAFIYSIVNGDCKVEPEDAASS